MSTITLKNVFKMCHEDKFKYVVTAEEKRIDIFKHITCSVNHILLLATNLQHKDLQFLHKPKKQMNFTQLGIIYSKCG